MNDVEYKILCSLKVRLTALDSFDSNLCCKDFFGTKVLPLDVLAS